jgi:hypothetical protein
MLKLVLPVAPRFCASAVLMLTATSSACSNEPVRAAAVMTVDTAKVPPPPVAGDRNVLLELFSSEGCSSCPPADTLLDKLEQTQPVAGVHVIALEFHVDYWNRLGWTDPFSKAEYTERQRAYGQALKKSNIYTPQMVVDGAVDFVGSSEKSATTALAAAGAVAAPVTLRADRSGDTINIQIAPYASALSVYLTRSERGLTTQVPSGENAGKTLHHAPVVRSLELLGKTVANVAFGANPAVVRMTPNYATVVFVADPVSLHVLAAAELRD